MVPIILLYS